MGVAVGNFMSDRHMEFSLSKTRGKQIIETELKIVIILSFQPIETSETSMYQIIGHNLDYIVLYFDLNQVRCHKHLWHHNTEIMRKFESCWSKYIELQADYVER